MIQQFLSYSAEAIAIGSIALYSYLFLSGLMARRRISPGQLSLFDDVTLTDAEVEQLQQPIAPAAPKFAHAIVPFKRPAQKLPDLTSLSIRQLKAVASRAKLPRYNVDPKDRLIHRLTTELERDRLVAALAA